MSLVHRYLFRYLIVVILSVITGFAMANDARPVAPPQDAQLKRHNIGPQLGIRTDVLPKELSAQLNEDVLIGQGILVTGFTENSPAKKQGMKVYDILLAYDGHPLMHPKEFIGMVKKDKPGREVKLTISRQGKLLTIPVSIAAEAYPLNEDQLDYQYNLQVEGYDGVKIKQLSREHYEATIRYLAPDGVVRRHTFSGWYKNLLREISQAPFLTQKAKFDLIKALKKQEDDEKGWLGDWMPFSDGVF